MNFLVVLVVIALVWWWLDYVYYRKPNPSKIKGATFMLPFIGAGISVLKDADNFWRSQSAMHKDISCTLVFGRLLVYVRNRKMMKKILDNQYTGYFRIVADPFDTGLFGDHNMMGLERPEHMPLKKSLHKLFTPEALKVYRKKQFDLMCQMIDQSMEAQKSSGYRSPLNAQLWARELNLTVSRTVLWGTDFTQEELTKLSQWYWDFNLALFSLPIRSSLINSQLEKGFASIDNISHLMMIKAEKRIAQLRSIIEQHPCPPDVQPFQYYQQFLDLSNTCVAEQWILQILLEQSYDLDPKKLGLHLFDQLYAAQDASVSSLVWALMLLDIHRDVQKKLRDELDTFMTENNILELTAEHLDQICSLPYLEKVCKEILRFRPPAPFLPHRTLKDFEISDDEGKTYIITKNTIVFPSIVDYGFPDDVPSAQRFDPDANSSIHSVPFGIGVHMCLGRTYAQ